MVSKNQDLTLFKEDPGNVGFEIDGICGGSHLTKQCMGFGNQGDLESDLITQFQNLLTHANLVSAIPPTHTQSPSPPSNLKNKFQKS